MIVSTLTEKLNQMIMEHDGDIIKSSQVEIRSCDKCDELQNQ